jgi:hypothetical protein
MCSVSCSASTRLVESSWPKKMCLITVGSGRSPSRSKMHGARPQKKKTQVHHLDCGTPGPAPAERVGRRWVGRSTHHNFRQEARQNINSDEFAGIMRSNATDIPPSAIIMRPSASMFCRPIRAHLVGQWCVRQRRIKWGLFTNLGGISRTGFPHTIIWI